MACSLQKLLLIVEDESSYTLSAKRGHFEHLALKFARIIQSERDAL